MRVGGGWRRGGEGRGIKEEEGSGRAARRGSAGPWAVTEREREAVAGGHVERGGGIGGRKGRRWMVGTSLTDRRAGAGGWWSGDKFGRHGWPARHVAERIGAGRGRTGQRKKPTRRGCRAVPDEVSASRRSVRSPCRASPTTSRWAPNRREKRGLLGSTTSETDGCVTWKWVRGALGRPFRPSPGVGAARSVRAFWPLR
jgi:hypothetical protein